MPRHSLIYATAIFTATALIWSFARFRAYAPAPISHREYAPGAVPLRLENASLVGRAHGAKAWEIAAKTIELNENGTTVTFVSVTKAALLRDGWPVAGLVAGRALYSVPRQTIAVTQGLALHSGELGVKARSALWSVQEQTLICPGAVVFTLPGGGGRGRNLILDLGKQELCAEGVSMRLRAPDGETADGV